MSKLKEKRKERGFSRSELSRLSGVSVDLIVSLESGRRSIWNCSLKNVISLACSLNCNFLDILEESDNKELNEFLENFCFSLL